MGHFRNDAARVILPRVTIQKRLFAVSPTPAIQSALTTQEAIVARIQAAQSYAIGATVRLQWYDPDAAMAWLAYCRSDRFSREAINSLPSLEQNTRVVELWDAFGKFWQCLNVSPYGWARFRRLVETLWGYPKYDIGGEGWRGKVNTPFGNGQYGGAWRQRAHAAIYTPRVTPDQYGSFSPAYGGVRDQFYTSGGGPEFGPDNVVFGTKEPYAIENAGNRAGEVGTLPNTNFAPTAEVHRVWLQRNGVLIGGYPNGLDRRYADSTNVSTINVRPQTMAQAWQTYNFHEPPTNVPGRWDDWTVGFALPNASETQVATDTQWTVVPLVWYWEILRGTYPLVTGSGYLDRAGYSSFADITPTVTMSVLDYLASKTPDEIIREVMFDVMQRNSAMADANGIVERNLGDAAGIAEIARQRAATAPSTAAMIVEGAVTAVGGVVSLATASPAGLAMAGMVSQAVKLVDSLSSAPAEQRRTDIFGRLMPTLDTVGIVDGEVDARRVIGGAGLPSGATGGGSLLFLGGTALIQSILNSGPLRVVEMPPYGEVEVGQERVVPQCRWEADGQTVWRCTIPTGPQWIRVTTREGESRLARTETSNIAPASITWSAMFPQHDYRITGLPPMTSVFVDGAAAMGTWTDAGQQEWRVWMPTGRHDVRLVPPTGSPVLVSVEAAGASSLASWAQLQTMAEQQRQTAAGGTPSSNTGLWLALVVALGAGALFVATTQTDGSQKRENPRRRARR